MFVLGLGLFLPLLVSAADSTLPPAGKGKPTEEVLAGDQPGSVDSTFMVLLCHDSTHRAGPEKGEDIWNNGLSGDAATTYEWRVVGIKGANWKSDVVDWLRAGIAVTPGRNLHFWKLEEPKADVVMNALIEDKAGEWHKLCEDGKSVADLKVEENTLKVLFGLEPSLAEAYLKLCQTKAKWNTDEKETPIDAAEGYWGKECGAPGKEHPFVVGIFAMDDADGVYCTAAQDADVRLPALVQGTSGETKMTLSPVEALPKKCKGFPKKTGGTSFLGLSEDAVAQLDVEEGTAISLPGV